MHTPWSRRGAEGLGRPAACVQDIGTELLAQARSAVRTQPSHTALFPRCQACSMIGFARILAYARQGFSRAVTLHLAITSISSPAFPYDV